MRTVKLPKLGGPQMGAALMLGSVVIVGVGFVFTRVLSAPLQGTLGMTIFGGGILVAIALKHDGIQGLNPRKLTPRQRRGMLLHALTSSLMKIGGPIAFSHIGAGPYASFTALGSLLAGFFETTRIGRALRVPILLAVLLATGALQGVETASWLGIGAALTAATHPLGLPSQAKLLGDKRDQGLAQANVICMLVVTPLCFPLAKYLGTPIEDWTWGKIELVAMFGAGLFATALAAVMQTRASLYLTKGGMGVWGVTAPAVQPVVAVALAPVLLTLFGIATVIPSHVQWLAFGIVTSTSAIAAWLDAEAAEAAAAQETPTRRD